MVLKIIDYFCLVSFTLIWLSFLALASFVTYLHLTNPPLKVVIK